MAAYTQPQASAYFHPSYASPPPQVQVQQAPPPPIQHPSYQRPRGPSNGSYDGQQYGQQLTPYAAPLAAPYGSHAFAGTPNGQPYYFPSAARAQSAAALVPAAAQLHPQEAYADAFAPPRPRTGSTASHRSRHSAASQRSHHNHHSHHGKAGDEEDRRKPGERATLGDTLMGMWRVLRDLIPTERR